MQARKMQLTVRSGRVTGQWTKTRVVKPYHSEAACRTTSQQPVAAAAAKNTAINGRSNEADQWRALP